MNALVCQGMGKKSEFIRIRADDQLKEALAKAAARDIRTEADEARYILMKELGLLIEEESTTYRLQEQETDQPVTHDLAPHPAPSLPPAPPRERTPPKPSKQQNPKPPIP